MNTMTIDVAEYLTMKQDLDKLKKENEELKDNITTLQYQNDMEKQCHAREFCDIESDTEDLRTEVQDLKEENEIFLDEIKELKEELKEQEEDTLREWTRDYWTADKELEKLKKEHEKLKKKREEDCERLDEAEETIEELDEHIEKLEKDNDKLEKEVSVLLAVASGDYKRADDFKALCKERFEEEFIDACDDDTLVGQYFTE